MDSLPFSRFSLLSPKKYKIYLGELSQRDESPEVYLFPQSTGRKRGKHMPVDVFLYQFNECERTRSLDDVFNFKESEKSLTMDSVGVPFS